LFANRRVSYTYNTRAAIRACPELLGMQPGEEILAPSYNCGSEIDPFLHAGLTVRLYAVDGQAQIDISDIENRISPHTRAVYVTHYFGFIQPEMPALRELCNRRGLFLIEDCALSLLSGAHPAEGRSGDISLFCFYKFFPVIGGGAMVVNNPDLPGPPGFLLHPPRSIVTRQAVKAGIYMLPGGSYTLARLRQKKLARHAHDVPEMAGVGRPDMPDDYYYDPALNNARISRLASLPIRSFDIAATIAARRRNFQHYQDLLRDLPHVRPLFAHLSDEVCPLSMPVLVADRDVLAREMQAQQIDVAPWWAGYHRGLDFDGFDAACDLKDRVLSLPLHQGLGPAQIEKIVSVLRGLLK
jgi:perosamine synthetase